MTFGKVMGGGFPAAAFGGRADVMSRLAPEGPVYQAGTLSGNPVATTAGLTTLRLATDEVYAHLTAAGETIKAAAAEALTAAGVPHVVQSTGTMFSVFFTDRPVRDFADASAPGRRRVRRVLPRHARRGRPPAAVGVRGVVPLLGPRRPRRADRARRPARRRPRRGRRRATVSAMTDADRSSTCCATARCTTPTACSTAGRPGYHLSDLGRQMAEQVADTIKDRDIIHLRASPLERAQETAQPLAGRAGSRSSPTSG